MNPSLSLSSPTNTFFSILSTTLPFTFLASVSNEVLVVISLFGIAVFRTVVTDVSNSVIVPVLLVSVGLPRTVVIIILGAVTVNVLVTLVAPAVLVPVLLPGVELVGTVVALVSPPVTITEEEESSVAYSHDLFKGYLSVWFGLYFIKQLSKMKHLLKAFQTRFALTTSMTCWIILEEN